MTSTRGERWHREAEAHLVRDGVAMGLALAMGWGVLTAMGCVAADASREAETSHAYEPFMIGVAVHDRMQEVEKEDATTSAQQGQPTEEIISEDLQEAPYEEWVPYQEEYMEWDSQPEYHPTGGMTPEGGVNWYDGRMETYYSSNVAYHYRTPEWTVDDEGFYRTDEGYYVVAVSKYEMDEGTVFEGSRGLCQVLDCGCDAGVTDYYVAW